MGYLIFNLVTALLLIGFLALSAYEERRGVRVLAEARNTLDERVTHITFILTHVDLPIFLQEEARRLASRLGHFMVALSLQAVRSIERLLTRLIVYLRSRHPVVNGEEETRPFLKALSDFKDTLKDNASSDNSDIK